MENNQIMQKEKLEVFGIVKEALKIPYKNPKFIILTFLTSLPLICTMVLHELILQKTLIETTPYLKQTPPDDPFLDYYYYYYYYWQTPALTTISLFKDVSPRFLQLGLLYLVPLHLLDLLNTIATVKFASVIYGGDRSMSLKEMLQIPINKTSLKGPLITSLYVLCLNSFILLGLIWGLTNSIIPSFGTFFVVLYGVGSTLLLVKWMDWSAILNMSIVISILDQKNGLEALEASAYFSRTSRTRGLHLMLVFFIWRIGLRVSCLYVGGHEKWGGLVATSVLSCVGNVMKWVVCVVFFYDCKKRVLEKKFDVEEGGKVHNTGSP